MRASIDVEPRTYPLAKGESVQDPKYTLVQGADLLVQKGVGEFSKNVTRDCLKLAQDKFMKIVRMGTK